MEVQSRIIAPFTAEHAEAIEPVRLTQDLNQVTQPMSVDSSAKPRESRLDLISTSIVYGLTTFFVAYIFGVVTDYIPSMLVNSLLSLLGGLCVGVIAYVLMKGDD